VPSAVYGTRSVPTTLELNNLFPRGRLRQIRTHQGRKAPFQDRKEARPHRIDVIVRVKRQKTGQ
jgi:hypothetical protein